MVGTLQIRLPGQHALLTDDVEDVHSLASKGSPCPQVVEQGLRHVKARALKREGATRMAGLAALRTRSLMRKTRVMASMRSL